MKVIKQSAHIVKEWPKMNLYERCEFAGRISHASENKIKEGSAEEFVRRMVRLGHESVFEFARIAWHGGVDPGGDYCTLLNLRGVRFCARNYFRLNGEEGEIGHALREIAQSYPEFFSDFPEDHPIWKNQPYNPYPWRVADDWDWIPVIIITNRAISHQLVRYRKEVVYLQASQRFIKFHDDVDFISPDVYFDLDDKMYSLWLASMEGAEQDYIHCLSQGYSAQAARLFLPNSAATKLIMYASSATWKHVFEQRISNKADPMIRELLTPLKEEFEKEKLL